MKLFGGLGRLVLVAMGCASFSAAASAVVINQGESARITFTSTTGTPPFDYIPFHLMFSQANPFGTNETLSYATFDANNASLTSATVDSGSSVYTSGLFAQLTQYATVNFSSAKALTTPSFSLVVTAVAGSFDLTDATADFQHLLTPGVNQFGVVGVFAIPAVPEPVSWAMMVGGFGLVGGAVRRARQRAVRFALT